MLAKYNRHARLKWIPEARASYEQLKLAIHGCPRLYYMDDKSPIYLHTDASNYVIGAYLFQVVDGIQHPIAFLGKFLDDRMLH